MTLGLTVAAGTSPLTPARPAHCSPIRRCLHLAVTTGLQPAWLILSSHPTPSPSLELFPLLQQPVSNVRPAGPSPITHPHDALPKPVAPNDSIPHSTLPTRSDGPPVNCPRLPCAPSAARLLSFTTTYFPPQPFAIDSIAPLDSTRPTRSRPGWLQGAERAFARDLIDLPSSNAVRVQHDDELVTS